MLREPNGVVVDAAGNLLVADSRNNRVRKINAQGIISTMAGGGTSFSDGIPATNAFLDYPFGLALDAANNLYVVASFNHRVRLVSSNGVISTVAGNTVAGFSGDNGPATSASVNSPSGVALDAAGNIYIADSTNQRIRKVSSGGTINTVAGNGLFKFSGDGGQAARCG